ncbi:MULTISPECIES: helix-turn-helix domain-containing protein [unclassified Aureimonas]|uniref:helix-turn-helix domain-containing protein n=1 Tax=unclassified Aureimonas TaxID=2615206 RepID=UPI0006FB7849|nr:MULTISPECIES: AraC family transcriptional regulator [unclassified Aureimonas]KQT69001.1 hypothetical protein ASG54_04910 [Aureimonas sp. Leaf460]KQT69231.1 hypothetical protein ASG62_17515 [Aureimonas sp. Leaf427]
MGIAIGAFHAEGAAELPAMPRDLFVGTVDGVATCTPDEHVHDIWPKFMVMILLEGRQRFVIDDTAFAIDAGSGGTASPVVLLLNVARYAKLFFVNDSQVPLRKVMISAPLPWVRRHLEGQGQSLPGLRRFFGRHLASFEFRPGQHAIALAEQIMRPPPLLRGEIAALYAKSRALELMVTGCSALVEGAEPPAQPRLAIRRQAERVRDHILARLGTELTIEAIAGATGASVSAVQRHFKLEFGMTVFDFIRLKRLERAREMLEGDGATIAQAAYEAGYANATAFATAFKKTFGAPPRHHRR